MTTLRSAAALALLGLAAAASPAAAQTDGTSNTIQYAVVDQAHHRVLFRGPALTPGRRYRTAELVTPSLSYTFENVMVESDFGLNYTTVALVPSTGGCRAAVDLCLIEEDGTYPPAPPAA